MQEKLINEKTLPNGVIQKTYTSRNLNLAYLSLLLIGGVGIAYGFGGAPTALIMCQNSFMKATNEIMRYNEENPEYKVPLPEYNCNEVLIQKNATGGTTPEASGTQELTLRDRFGLGDCRFINDFHRLGKYNLEWTAYDIACEVGKSFEVRSPGEYKLSYKGYGVNLGNYIILEKVANTNIRIVLAHIVNEDEQNTIYNYNDVVGKTDVSGASTNYHVHIELWDNFYNVSREFAIDKPYKSINGTALLNHRQWDFGQQKKDVFYFTSYNLGDVKQNDATPCIGASGKDLCQLEASGVRTMALTSDIRLILGVGFGAKVRLIGEEGCEGVFQVEDEMNKRFRQTPGVLRPNSPYYIKGDLPSKKGGVCSVEKI